MLWQHCTWTVMPIKLLEFEFEIRESERARDTEKRDEEGGRERARKKTEAVAKKKQHFCGLLLISHTFRGSICHASGVI